MMSCVRYAVAREAFSRARHLAINCQETASASGEPYLLVPGSRRRLGVVLVHGFLASPAELKAVWRAPGSGWLSGDRRASERPRNFAMGSARALLAGLARLGEARATRSCSTLPSGSASSASLPAARWRFISPPTGPKGLPESQPFHLPSGSTIATLCSCRSFTASTGSPNGFPPKKASCRFRINPSEHPHINYRHVPIRGLFELRRVSR